MKSCPTCNRTFEDDLTFCLVDGAILSAPYNPQATQLIPEPYVTSPPQKESLRDSDDLLTVMRSSAQISPSVPGPAAQYATVGPEQKLGIFIKWLIKGVFLGIIIGAAAGSILWVTHSRYYYKIGLPECAIAGAILGAITFPILRASIVAIKYAWK